MLAKLGLTSRAALRWGEVNWARLLALELDVALRNLSW
jgi:hypothetical protein